MNYNKVFPLKMAVGYLLLVAVLAAAAVFVWRYARSAMQLSAAGQALASRRAAADRLVYGLLDVDNRERAVYMNASDGGDVLTSYIGSVEQAVAAADSLASLLPDSVQRMRIDTLTTLLVRRSENTCRLSLMLAESASATLYEQRADRLRRGLDSLLVSAPADTTADGGQRVTTYVVEKTRRTFFGRLADAFRHSRSDTTAVRVDTLAGAATARGHSVNVADTVAGVLTEVSRREARLRRQRTARIAAGIRTLQEAGAELNARMEVLMRDIGSSEREWTRRALADDAARRHATVVRVGAMAAVATVAALVLLVMVWRDNRRAARYRRSTEEARERAEQLMEQRERLLLTITHDIKAPVSAISGFTELLRPHVADGQPRTLLDNIRGSSLHLLRLVGSLLDYHRLEQGRMEVSEVSFSPARLLADCTDGFRQQAQARGLSLTLQCETQVPAVCRGDAFRLRQIADNLLSNAIKYTDRGGVTVRLGMDGGRLRLAVADTGRGMTEAESLTVFRAFTRLPGAQGTEGVGLGLSITRELVTLLGGDIALDTRPGGGSTFTVTLPVACGGSEPRCSVADAGELSILAVDDDPLQLQLLTGMLGALSDGRWRVTACTSVDEMLEHAASGRFDLLLTDIEMPAANGFEIAARLRGSRLPVVAMTAHDSISADDFARAGFAARLHKPLTPEELADVITCVTACSVPSASGGTPVSGGSAPSSASRFAPLTAFADGDEAAARDILRSFREQTVADIAALRRAAADRNAKAAGSLAHRLLPVFTMIGSPVAPLMRLLADARQAESVPPQFDDWCARVLEDMERTVSETGTM